MPKIEIYDAQSAPRGKLQVNRAAPEDFGAGLARGLRGAGRKLQEKAEKDAAFWVEKTVAEARGAWARQMQERQDAAELGAPEFTDKLLLDYDEFRGQLLEQAPTATSRKMLDGDLERLRSTLTGQAAGFQAAAAANARITAATDTLTNNVNTVRSAPQMLDDSLEQDSRLIDRLDIPAEAKQKLHQDHRWSLGFASGMGRLDKIEEIEDAQAFADELRNTPYWKQRTSEVDYSRLLSRADALVKQLGAKAEAEYASNFDEAMREVETGVENGRYTAPEIRAMVSDPELQEKMIRRQAQARETGAAVNAIRIATPEERRAYLAEVQGRLARPDAKDGPINFDEEVRDLGIRQRAVERVEQALETDAASYVLQVSEPVRKAYQRTIEEQNSPEAIQEFVTAMTAEQQRLRGPDAPVNLLTGDHAASIATDLAAVERTPEGAQQAYERLVVLADTWGKHWPTVMRQLQQAKVLRGTDAVAANLTRPDQRPVGQNLMRAAFIGDKELVKRQGVGFDAKTVDSNIEAALTEFKASTTHQLGGFQVYRDYSQAVRTLALYYMDAHHMGSGDAVDTAARQVLLDQYQFVGNYRVPRGVNADTISRSASHLKRRIADQDFEVPLSLAGLDDADSKAAAASVLASEGVWATNGDETGLQLLWPDGTAVETPDGRPLQFTWDELANNAPPPLPVRESERTGRNPAMRP